ncbi:MAG: hypothetical protein DRR06_13460 [Gammaproteobacteria bacterium]|nr:MAG: hypothetical protein DRR06_13460 [Gammaproteobacteria bacterium]
MDKDKPTGTFSMNVAKMMVYKGVAVTAITIVAAVWGAGVIIASVMSSAAQVNFDRRLKLELKPEGDIRVKIESVIDGRIKENNDRLLRMETMLDPMYESITGNRAPERVHQ